MSRIGSLLCTASDEDNLSGEIRDVGVRVEGVIGHCEGYGYGVYSAEWRTSPSYLRKSSCEAKTGAITDGGVKPDSQAYSLDTFLNPALSPAKTPLPNI